MKIFLIGFMGSGKSYWGRRWAERYGLPFIDLDQQVEEREHETIAAVFEKKGEAYFRETETSCLRGFSQHESFIMACGGGVPCFHDNIQWMNEQGTTVYLAADPPLLLERLIHEKDKRPLLKELDHPALLYFIENKLSERSVFYNQAKLVLPVNELNENSLSQLVTINQ